jgi:hypothetical protein
MPLIMPGDYRVPAPDSANGFPLPAEASGSVTVADAA